MVSQAHVHKKPSHIIITYFRTKLQMISSSEKLHTGIHKVLEVRDRKVTPADANNFAIIEIILGCERQLRITNFWRPNQACLVT